MALTDVVRVSISIQAAALQAAGFGVPLILGTNGPFDVGELWRLYTSLSGMLDDGFVSSDAEYVAAQALLGQAKRPRNFLVGLRGTPVAQVNTIEITAVANATDYTLSISRLGRNPVVVTYTSDGSALNTEIRDGLIALIEAAFPSILDGTIVDADTFTVTALEAGVSFTISASTPNLSSSVTTPNHGGAEDLDDIVDQQAAWYCTLMAEREDDSILEVARWTESIVPPRVFMAQSSDDTAPASAYDSSDPNDVAEILRALNYRRTALWWHDDDAEHVDAAIAGAMLPLDPGSETWAIKQLSGVTPTLGVGSAATLPITDSQKANLAGAGPGPGGKHANVYYSLTDEIAITWRGTMASGNWIDEIRFVDFLTADMSAKIANVELNNPKVPFTDQGIGMFAAQVHASLQNGERVGGIARDPKYTVVVPSALDVSAANRAARVLDPPITFVARLAGAIHEVAVEGTVSS